MMFNNKLREEIRSAFPRAAVDFRGRKRIFFDNGTATLVVDKAAKAESVARIECSANVGAIFDESKQAEAVIQKGREDVADFLNASSPSTIVTGESATSLMFNLSYALGREFSGKENVVTTNYEHYTNVSPWVELEERGKIKELRCSKLSMDEGTLNLEHLQELIDSNTKIVTVTSASNMFGTKTPLKEVGKLAKEVGAYFIVDAVHHIAHGPTDVQEIDCDFLVFSGYKLFSSHGSYLYGKQEHLETVRPFKVKPATNIPPGKFEWGTRNQASFAAISGVMDHFHWLACQIDPSSEDLDRKKSLRNAMNAIEGYEKKFSESILTGVDDVPGLLEIPEVKIFGITDIDRLNERDPTFSIEIDNVSGDEIAKRLWKDAGIAARAGHFYSYAQDIYNKPKVYRISLVHYNTHEEIKIFLKALNNIVI
ncbi:aminotransferase class V-fold PLP-dependent enzyme [Candidatus Heimdallarchaeota archaeon]|nr:MAG: aminotransferase class V-fold PLP-dependent enzyme [Candidatus Heimdallarchaeota archaeon]